MHAHVCACVCVCVYARVCVCVIVGPRVHLSLCAMYICLSVPCICMRTYTKSCFSTCRHTCAVYVNTDGWAGVGIN